MKNNKQKIGDLGQHWTPHDVVDIMVSLLDPIPTNVLEPTAGNGRFLRNLFNKNIHHVDAVEIDSKVIPDDIKQHYHVGNFFSWSGGQYDAIIGNPPYVAGKILGDSLSDWQGCIPKTANLYLHVIEKCVKEHIKPGGQIVFIVPDTLLDGTSRGKKLRDWMHNNGAFTHVLKPNAKWENASVGTLIFRWVHGKFQEAVQTNEGPKNLIFKNGNIWLSEKLNNCFFGDFFDIGVGAAPQSKLLTTPDDVCGQSFLKSQELVWYQTDDRKKWPRWRITQNKHKLLIKPGPTRSKNVIYSTTKWELQQSSRHLDIFAIPKFNIKDEDLEILAQSLNDWFLNNDEELGLRKKGRWIIGVKQISEFPIDLEFKNIINQLKY